MEQKDYDTLKTTHSNLPEFTVLDQEFFISQIEAKTHVLVEIKRKIAEKMETVLHFLTGLLNPEGINIFECRSLTKKDQQELLDTYRHLMEYYRLLLETDIISTEQAHSSAIAQTTKVWIENKEKILEIIQKTRSNWKKTIEPKEVLDYLG